MYFPLTPHNKVDISGVPLETEQQSETQWFPNIFAT